jgi:two-component sensor histidine kinase
VLSIVFERTGDDFQLRVRDDGVGIREAVPPEGLGTRLVHALAAQLGGRLQIENGTPGTEHRLVFPAS